jgi:hypothetical protein
VVSARASSEAINLIEIVEYDDFTVTTSNKKLETTTTYLTVSEATALLYCLAL